MNLWQVIPRDAWVEVMLKMIVFITHEPSDDRMSENTSSSLDVVGRVFEERVLAHSANVDHGVDEEHWNQPSMEQDLPRNR